MRGLKTGGRTLGTPNKRTATVMEKLEALGCDPIEAMAKMAMDEATPLAIRVTLLRELAEYMWPKRKAVSYSAWALPALNWCRYRSHHASNLRRAVAFPVCG